MWSMGVVGLLLRLRASLMEHEEDGVFSIYMPTGCGMGELGERWGLKGMKLAREVWRSGERIRKRGFRAHEEADNFAY